tara:strand:+ start:226 stop:435 length:210 start_codon:yes stop_codon:yes gene_type:complete
MEKKRTLNEYRQTKDIVYIKPTEVAQDYHKTINFNQQIIIDLIKKYPNDADLGKEIRKYYLHIKNRVSL